LIGGWAWHTIGAMQSLPRPYGELPMSIRLMIICGLATALSVGAEPAPRIHTTILDQGSREPVVGARVTVEADLGARFFRASSDREGKAVFSGRWRGGKNLWVEHEAYRPVSFPYRKGAETPSVPGQILLTPYAAWRGRVVTDGTGQPLPFCTLRLRGVSYRCPFAVVSQKDGTFILRCLPGRYHMLARFGVPEKGQHRAFASSWAVVDCGFIEKTDQERVADIRVPRTVPLSLKFELSDAAKAEATPAMVLLYRSKGRAVALSHARVKNASATLHCAPGTYVVELSGGGHFWKSDTAVTVKADGENRARLRIDKWKLLRSPGNQGGRVPPRSPPPRGAGRL